MHMNERPLVSICCVTYNQARFIDQALRGFLMQETSFPFEIVIHDDASSDGTARIISRYAEMYPEKICALFEEENQFSQGVDIWEKCVLPYTTGKYLAFCDGDDYWTDPHKLQRQVDYLESHPACSCVFHPVNYVEQDAVLCTDHTEKTECNFTAEQIIIGGGLFCATASLCCRSEYALQYPRYRKMADVADYPLQVLLASKGYFHYLPQVMAAYRCHVVGSWSNKMEDQERKAAHFRNEISWLQEFDAYTGHRYCQSVSYRLLYYYLVMFRDGCGGLTEVKTLIRNMNWGRQKAKAILKVSCYFGQRLLRMHIPKLYAWLEPYCKWRR